MFSFILLLTSFVLSLTTATSPFTLPKPWQQIQRTPSHQIITIHFGLKQTGTHQLHQTLLDLSNPESTNYGQWLSKSQVESIVYTNPIHIENVISWITNQTSAAAIIKVVGSDAIRLTASASEIESLFHTELHQVRHPNSNQDHTRATTKYIHTAIPKSLQDIIQIITPIFNFIRPQKRQRRPTTAADPPPADPSIIPQTINNIYNIPLTTSSSIQFSTQAVAEMQHALGPEGFNKNDLNMYQTTFQLKNSLIPTTVVGKNDGIDQTGECTLDTDVVMTVAPGAPTTFWMVDEWMYELGLALNVLKTPPPSVVSISWGFSETRQCGPTDYGPDMPANCTYLGITSNVSYVEKTNIEFMKLSARGITLIASSGDSGAPGDINADCSFDANPTYALNPAYPASSPYVLSIGATQLSTYTLIDSTKAPKPCKKGFFWQGFKCAVNGTEEIASTKNGAKITTGGGFSVYAARPKWQDQAVLNYLKTSTLPPSTLFNSSNRAYPDVAALGHNILLYLKGTGSKGWDNFDGTSASAPIWAGIITRLNSLRLNQNKTSLGMVAPLLYSIGSTGFTDIVVGDNKCTRSDGNNAEATESTIDGTCCKYGYESSKGWDPVSGLGTPRYEVLKKYVENLP